MGAYSVYCEKIQPYMQGLLQKWEEISSALQQIPEQLDTALTLTNDTAAKEKVSYNETKSRISTYIRMATGGEEHEASSSGRKACINFAVLRQLSSCETPSSNGYQLKLYDEACAQYRDVLTQIEITDALLSQEIADTKALFLNKQKQLESELNEIEQQYRQHFESSDFASFIEQLTRDNQTFVDGSCVTIGFVKTPMPVTASAALFLEKNWPEFFDATKRTINIAYQHNLHDGGVFVIDYDTTNEKAVVCGIQNCIINAIQNDLVQKVYLFDPVRYNNEMLGPLSPLAGAKGSHIARVPLSDEGIVTTARFNST